MHNRIAHHHCMNYYWKCCKDRKEKLHDEEVQQKRIIEWQQNEKTRSLESQHLHVRNFEIEKKLYIETCATDCIRRLIYVLKQIKEYQKSMKETTFEVILN